MNLTMNSQEKLRRHLLGQDLRHGFEGHVRRGQWPVQVSTCGSKPLPSSMKGIQAGRHRSDSEEDEGRSTLGRSKRSKIQRPPRTSAHNLNEHAIAVDGISTIVPNENGSQNCRKKSNYLDEVLASMSKARP